MFNSPVVNESISMQTDAGNEWYSDKLPLYFGHPCCQLFGQRWLSDHCKWAVAIRFLLSRKGRHTTSITQMDERVSLTDRMDERVSLTERMDERVSLTDRMDERATLKE